MKEKIKVLLPEAEVDKKIQELENRSARIMKARTFI